MSIQQAIHLNNKAAAMLESNRFSEALCVSRAAMELFQKHQCWSTAKQVSIGGKDIIDQCIFARDRHCSSDETNDDFIYEHGIVLPLNAVDGTIITPVLIFNCALCHHLMGARHCTDFATSQAFLNKARRLYKIAYSEQYHDCNTVFTIAIVNNVGIVHKKLGSNEEAEECVDHLTSIMMVCVASNERKYLQPIQGCWKNILGNGRSIAPSA